MRVEPQKIQGGSQTHHEPMMLQAHWSQGLSPRPPGEWRGAASSTRAGPQSACVPDHYLVAAWPPVIVAGRRARLARSEVAACRAAGRRRTCSRPQLARLVDLPRIRSCHLALIPETIAWASATEIPRRICSPRRGTRDITRPERFLHQFLRRFHCFVRLAPL